MGLVTQAFCVCATAMLFVALKNQYGISYTALGALTFINFAVQILMDFGISSQVDKWGFKKVAVAAPVFVIVGTVIFIIAPFALESPYPLFVVGTIIFAAASGLLEVTVSPIVDNLPGKNKEKSMGLLHGFYGIGQIFVVVVITLLVLALGEERWQIILAAFLILPIATLIIFVKAPFVDCKQNGRNLTYKEFLTKPVFWLFMASIVCGGVCEMIMAQWSSTLFEVAFGLEKWVGDLFAVATFAAALTAGRLIYGKLGDKMNLSVVCIIGSLLCLVAYICMAFVGNAAVCIVMCMVCGFGASMLWPGTLTLATKKFSRTSTKFFGALSGAGDTGDGFGPFLTGLVADNIFILPNLQDLTSRTGLTAEQLGLKVGLLVGAVFALCSIIVHIAIKKELSKGQI